MSSSNPTQSRPRPKAFLLAGVTTPPRGYSIDERVVGSLGDVAPFLRADPKVPGTRSLTVFDEHGALLGVVSGRSTGFLATPPTCALLVPVEGEIVRDPQGFLSYPSSSDASLPMPEELAIPVLGTKRYRPVTIDLSVILAGLNRKHFSTRDAIFISAALEIELATSFAHRQTASGRIQRRSMGHWDGGVPVPIDASVLDIFREIVPLGLPRGDSEPQLDRTDLLCAATAIAYESPLFTTKPDAYARIKNGLRVVEYPSGGKRSDALHAADRSESASVVPSLRTDESLRSAYARGVAFGPEILERLHAADSSAVDLTDELIAILSDENRDVSWHRGLMEHAASYRAAVPASATQHVDLIVTVSGVMARLRETPFASEILKAGFRALGVWGVWPDDASAEVLDDLERDPSIEYLWPNYRSYLSMAGIPDAIADAEIDALRRGAGRASRSRIEELRGGVRQ
jgi:hypothetical protein